ncbi:MAG TPA: hypothetical protein VMI31_04090, partial [Fimbriimonadaceae bacterium]|nr:hypothetical protein [Fimbriimonadaceae bacterium]
MTLFERPILSIESSCDETSAAVVCGGDVLSNVISSQAALHEKWGGVVPEAAARAHVEAILPAIEEALSSAEIGLGDVGAIAVTNRPGLIGALSVGVTAAKALAFALDVPLIGIHHLEGHICSAAVPLLWRAEALPHANTPTSQYPNTPPQYPNTSIPQYPNTSTPKHPKPPTPQYPNTPTPQP